MPRYNTENLADIHQYHTKLAQTVDDAEWLVNEDEEDEDPTLEDDLVCTF